MACGAWVCGVRCVGEWRVARGCVGAGVCMCVWARAGVCACARVGVGAGAGAGVGLGVGSCNFLFFIILGFLFFGGFLCFSLYILGFSLYI